MCSRTFCTCPAFSSPSQPIHFHQHEFEHINDLWKAVSKEVKHSRAAPITIARAWSFQRGERIGQVKKSTCGTTPSRWGKLLLAYSFAYQSIRQHWRKKFLCQGLTKVVFLGCIKTRDFMLGTCWSNQDQFPKNNWLMLRYAGSCRSFKDRIYRYNSVVVEVYSKYHPICYWRWGIWSLTLLPEVEWDTILGTASAVQTFTVFRGISSCFYGDVTATMWLQMGFIAGELFRKRLISS